MTDSPAGKKSAAAKATAEATTNPPQSLPCGGSAHAFAAGVVRSILMTQPVLPLLHCGTAGLDGKHRAYFRHLVFSIVSISSVLASPPWGVLGQSWGTVQCSTSPLLFSAVSVLSRPFPMTSRGLPCLRFIGGLAFAGIFPAINAVLESTNPADRGRVFRLLILGSAQFGVIGPIFGAALATWWGNQVAIAAAGAVLIPVVCGPLLLPSEKRSACNRSAAQQIDAKKAVSSAAATAFLLLPENRLPGSLYGTVKGLFNECLHFRRLIGLHEFLHLFVAWRYQPGLQ